MNYSKNIVSQKGIVMSGTEKPKLNRIAIGLSSAFVAGNAFSNKKDDDSENRRTFIKKMIKNSAIAGFTLFYLLGNVNCSSTKDECKCEGVCGCDNVGNCDCYQVCTCDKVCTCEYV